MWTPLYAVYFHSWNVRWNHNIYYYTFVQCQCNILLGDTLQCKKKECCLSSSLLAKGANIKCACFDNTLLQSIIVLIQNVINENIYFFFKNVQLNFVVEGARMIVYETKVLKKKEQGNTGQTTNMSSLCASNTFIKGEQVILIPGQCICNPSSTDGDVRDLKLSLLLPRTVL